MWRMYLGPGSRATEPALERDKKRQGRACLQRRLQGEYVEVEALVQRWRDEVTLLRRRGADTQAVTLESCASELEEEVRRLSIETLTLTQAGRESGYSYHALQKMLADGRLGLNFRPKTMKATIVGDTASVEVLGDEAAAEHATVKCVHEPAGWRVEPELPEAISRPKRDGG